MKKISKKKMDKISYARISDVTNEELRKASEWLLSQTWGPKGSSINFSPKHDIENVTKRDEIFARELGEILKKKANRKRDSESFEIRVGWYLASWFGRFAYEINYEDRVTPPKCPLPIALKFSIASSAVFNRFRKSKTHEELKEDIEERGEEIQEKKDTEGQLKDLYRRQQEIPDSVVPKLDKLENKKRYLKALRSRAKKNENAKRRREKFIQQNKKK